MNLLRPAAAVIVAVLLTTSMLVGFVDVATAVTPVTGCTVINSPGDYELQNDVTAGAGEDTCIAITSSDVNFDGAGYTIAGGHPDNDYGIRAHNSTSTIQNVDVADVDVRNFTLYGIYFDAVTNGSVWEFTSSENSLNGVYFEAVTNGAVRQGNTSDNGENGILFEDVANSSVWEVNASDNGLNGIYFDDVTNSSVWEVNASDNGDNGIYFDDVTSSSVWEVNASGNADDGVSVSTASVLRMTGLTLNSNQGGTGLVLKDVTDATVSDVIARFNDGDGFNIQNSANVSLSDAWVSHNAGSGGSVFSILSGSTSNVSIDGVRSFNNEGSGIRVRTATDVAVSNSWTFNNDQNGILVLTSTGLTVSDSLVFNNTDDGLSVFTSQDIHIERSLFNENVVGISLRNVTDVFVKESTISFNSEQGIDVPRVSTPDGVLQSTNITICCNEIVNNSEEGISLAQVKNVSVVSNVVNDNGRSGLRAHEQMWDVTIAENVFTDNRLHGIDVMPDLELTPEFEPDLANFSAGLVIRDNVVSTNGNATGIPASEYGTGINIHHVRDVTTSGNVVVENTIGGMEMRWVFNGSSTSDIVARNGGIGFEIGFENNDTSMVSISHGRFIDNGFTMPGDGLAVSANSTVDVHDSVIAGNRDWGVFKSSASTSTIVNATNNYWGAADGPGSRGPPVQPYKDALTGALADGSGDNVSKGLVTVDVSNVLFDPFLTEEPSDVPTLPATQYFQVDLAVGLPLCKVGPGEHAGFYSDDVRLVRYLHGNTDDGEIRQGSGPLSAAYAACLSDVVLTYDEVNSTVTATFTVAEGCELPITLAAYEKSSDAFLRSEQQTRYDSQTKVFGPGTHSLTVDLPDETA